MAAASPPDSGTWGYCRFCGVAVAPGAIKCGICGAADPIAASALPTESRRIRRRVKLTGAFRTVIVLAVVIGLAYALISAVVQGPPVVADPLTTAASYFLGPGNYTVISGNITGGDYVIGNWTSVNPPGIQIGIAVYNSSQWGWFTGGSGSQGNQWNSTPGASGRIIFSAPYTDMYYFVVTNLMPTSSHINVSVYVTTEYESNVGDDGFG
jgi:hypothetical protein